MLMFVLIATFIFVFSIPFFFGSMANLIFGCAGLLLILSSVWYCQNKKKPVSTILLVLVGVFAGYLASGFSSVSV